MKIANYTMTRGANASQRKDDFFEQLNLSVSTKRNYKQILTGGFFKTILLENSKPYDIFEITDLDELWKLYSIVNVHPQNIKVHRLCSAAIMRYIRFLNGGKKYGGRKNDQTKRLKVKKKRNNSDD